MSEVPTVFHCMSVGDTDYTPSTTAVSVLFHNSSSSFAYTEKKEISSFNLLKKRRGETIPPFPLNVGCLFSVHLQYSNTLIISAVLADLMRCFVCSAMITSCHCRCIQLPYSRTSLIPSCLRNLSLRYSHRWHLLFPSDSRSL